jgi:threonine aldolase
MEKNDVVDLRSDTVTKPTPEMRRAMYEAKVGDDFFGDDPTVNALQEKVAGILGTEAALWMPTGTMSNQVALHTLTEPGDEIIVDAEAHIFQYELGTAATFAGVQTRTVPSDRGVLDIEAVERATRPDSPWFPRTAVICIENTHNRFGGRVYPLEKVADVSEFARSRGISLYMDGARLFNASIAAGVRPSEYVKYADVVSVCMSKGLGAPAGSVLCGTREFIEKAKHYRIMHGGAMRQVGIIAAGGIYALDHHVERLADDHRRAGDLARKLADVPGIVINPDEVETNIVVFDFADGRDPYAFCGELAARGVLFVPFDPGVRAVTHLWIDDDAVDRAVAVVGDCLAGR